MGYTALAISLHPVVWVFRLWVPSMDAVSENSESLRAEVPSCKKGGHITPIQYQLPCRNNLSSAISAKMGQGITCL